MTLNVSFPLRTVAVAAGLLLSMSTHAALFEDTEARRAILDLRQRVERQGEEIQNFQRSLLEQQNQFEALREETARLRGEKEELTQALRRQQALSQGVDDRLKRFEPTQVKVDGVEFVAEPAESKAYEEALAVLRKGDFVAAVGSFNDFIKRNPKSGYVGPSLFWLGNAQYASRDYNNAIKNFNTLLGKAPSHQRAPEAMLSVANCQLELKDIKAARKTFGEVVKTYPHTEAASAASERLAKLK
ncbi:tol-pal system protein YbgF [Limnohabitans sp.]|uniref:tol-pal system protein YbgF n=1 Tax=Limnohabitans sp. TaxID=1907725 RepID=UPI00286EC695|nr:tol-pal system protein YbgF [Limnohabitans sp.]